MSAASETIPAISWAEANDAYLRTELHRLRLLFALKVRWLRRNWQADPIGSNHSLVISDATADRLLSSDGEAEEQRFYREDQECLSIVESLKEVEDDLVNRRNQLSEDGRIPSLESLVRLFGLSAAERDLLLLCFAIDEDPGFSVLAAYVHDNMNARYATPHLAQSLLCRNAEDKHAARHALLASSSLRRFKLLTLVDDGTPAGRAHQ